MSICTILRAFIWQPSCFELSSLVCRFSRSLAQLTPRVAQAPDFTTCEGCGKPDKANDSGWIRTHCDACEPEGRALSGGSRASAARRCGWRRELLRRSEVFLPRSFAAHERGNESSVRICSVAGIQKAQPVRV